MGHEILPIDPSVRVSKSSVCSAPPGDAAAAESRLAADLKALGVRPGGVLLVHSSLSALGWVPGGPETVIRGLEAALGSDGTLLLPALSYERVTRDQPVFDVLRTPGNVGTIPEWFRTRLGTLRSVHPTHSVCAAGPRAAELTDGHELDDTPVGPHSPFRRVRDTGGQVLFLGCDLTPNTSMHGVEELAGPPYLYADPVDYTIVLPSGEKIVHRHRPHGFAGVEQRYDRIASLVEPAGALWTGRALSGTAHLIEAAPMWSLALSALRANPWHFVERVGDIADHSTSIG